MKSAPLVIRDRPHELRVMVSPRVGLRGEITVMKFGRDRERLPVRVDRSRRAFQRVWEHRQPNLITNAGMDWGISGESSLGATSMAYNRLTNYVAVGTSSGAPAFTDTALGAEIAVSNQTLDLGTVGAGTHLSEGYTRYRRVRSFDFGEANGNLTEFGGRDAAGTESAILTRDLFRDEASEPVPITKTDEEQLAIQYDIFASASPTSITSAGTVTFTGLGTFNISEMAFQGATGATGSGGGNAGGPWQGVCRVAPTTAFSTTYTANTVTLPDGVPSQGLGGFVEAYTGGSYERAIEATWPALAEDQTINGVYIVRPVFTSGRLPMFGWRFDSPASLTKDKDYRIVFNARIIMSRA